MTHRMHCVRVALSLVTVNIFEAGRVASGLRRAPAATRCLVGQAARRHEPLEGEVEWFNRRNRYVVRTMRLCRAQRVSRPYRTRRRERCDGWQGLRRPEEKEGDVRTHPRPLQHLACDGVHRLGDRRLLGDRHLLSLRWRDPGCAPVLVKAGGGAIAAVRPQASAQAWSHKAAMQRVGRGIGRVGARGC